MAVLELIVGALLLVDAAVVRAAAVPAAAAPAAAVPMNTSLTDALAAKAHANLASYVAAKGYPKQNCTLENAAVRKEWGSLPGAERKAYIAAVQCLAQKPARYNSTIAPGARNRYDDFVANHIIQTPHVHFTGNFLPWHRYYLHAYETALKTECGYKGSLPYWNWGRWADNPVASPIFDGSDTSLSGNGAYHPHDGMFMGPAGQGGDCITTGPLVNWTVNLGPTISFLTQNGTSYVPPNPRADGLGYNPRCLRRDISVQSAMATFDNITAELISNHPDGLSFQGNIEGIHGGGHFTVGGDPGGDVYVSPGDPIFFLHHAQLDRVWWIWQNQDIEKRRKEPVESYTITWGNFPQSRAASIDDLVDVGPSGDPIKISELMSSIGGALCYVYE